MSAVTEKMSGLVLAFPARASETGKLYGSITSQMIADALSERIGEEISRRSIDTQPLRILGEHKVHVRLTVDLVPEIMVIVHREGESPTLALAASEEGTEPTESVPEALEVSEAEEAMEVENPEASQAETTP
jgi:large subunit ribosomal protein L9